MKIIFLDIDGVICLPGKWGPDPNCVEQINRIIKTTGAFIVLSSSWKHIECTFKESNDRIYRLGIQVLPDGSGTIIDHTPDAKRVIPGLGSREEEIQEWLDKNIGMYDKFVIIDDYPMDGALNPFSIKTAWISGLTKELADQAIKLLLE